MVEEEIEVEKFKRLVKEMYRGFPRWLYGSQVESVIPTENMRKTLERHGFLVIEPHVIKDKESFKYMLGPSALPLVSIWETEELTKRTVVLTEKIKKFTILAVTIALISLVISLMPAIIKFFKLS